MSDTIDFKIIADEMLMRADDFVPIAWRDQDGNWSQDWDENLTVVERLDDAGRYVLDVTYSEPPTNGDTVTSIVADVCLDSETGTTCFLGYPSSSFVC